MMDDAELLRCYAEKRAEDAFAELVRRRIGLVYSVALRHTGDAQSAEDVTQLVFTALAQKAAQLARRPVLVGWLYRSAQFAAHDARRAASRRQAREQEAHHMEQLAQDSPDPDWNRLRPVLDEVLNDLAEQDRDAILLRFFDNQPFAEIGAKLHLTENAARMRVERALEKMHAALTRRGVTSTTAALAAALSSPIALAMPAGLAATVTSAALADATGVAAGAVAAFSGSSLMATVKTNLWILAGVTAVSAAAVLFQQQDNAALKRELASLRQQDARAVTALAASQRMVKAKTAEVAARTRVVGDRLRGTVTLSASGVPTVTYAPALLSAADFSQTPGYKRGQLGERGMLSHDYAALFRRLHLDPSRQATLEQQLLEKRTFEYYIASAFGAGALVGIDPTDMGALKALVTAGTEDIDNQIRQELGAASFEELKNYSVTLNYRSQVNDLAGQLLHSGFPLRDEQADRMVALLAKDNTDVMPLPASFAADAAVILDQSQSRQLQTFIAALQARQTILAMNRSAQAQGLQLHPSPNGLLSNLPP